VETSATGGGVYVDLESLNRYVLIAILLFAALLYLALLYTGVTEFVARISKKGNRQKRSKNRDAAHGLRNSKAHFWRRFTRRAWSLPLERKR